MFHAKVPYLFLNSHVCMWYAWMYMLEVAIVYLWSSPVFLFVLLSQSLTNFSESIYLECPEITCLFLLCDVISGDLSLWHFCDFWGSDHQSFCIASTFATNLHVFTHTSVSPFFLSLSLRQDLLHSRQDDLNSLWSQVWPWPKPTWLEYWCAAPHLIIVQFWGPNPRLCQ